MAIIASIPLRTTISTASGHLCLQHQVRGVDGDSVGGVATGAGCAVRVLGGSGFDVVGVRGAYARTRCCPIFSFNAV
jgi:hypothetical protein